MVRPATTPAFLFDLDGTLIDSVYQHVIAWQAALSRLDIDLSVWRIHRRIGMSGGLFVAALAARDRRCRSTGAGRLAAAARTPRRYTAAGRHRGPAAGARELLASLDERGMRWAIATSGRAVTARPALGDARAAGRRPRWSPAIRWPRPSPTRTCSWPRPTCSVSTSRCAMIVGDSIWDLLAARRAGGLGVGLLTGGYAREELERAGAFRVYDDPARPAAHVDGRRSQALTTSGSWTAGTVRRKRNPALRWGTRSERAFGPLPNTSVPVVCQTPRQNCLLHPPGVSTVRQYETVSFRQQQSTRS